MKPTNLHLPTLLLLLLVAVAGCNLQSNENAQHSITVANADASAIADDAPKNEREATGDCLSNIAPYVNNIAQDGQGNYWFGTHAHGVCRYDVSATETSAEAFEYFSTREGFGGIAVTGSVADNDGNLWFATSGGVTRFSPAAAERSASGTQPTIEAGFTNFTKENGLLSNDVRSIGLDRNGTIWVGTTEGACYLLTEQQQDLAGAMFTQLGIPNMELAYNNGNTTARVVNDILEMRDGTLWFATNSGAYLFDPAGEIGPGAVTQLTEKDGLPENAVRCMLEDKAGNIWLGMHSKGISRYTPSEEIPMQILLTNFTQNGAVGGSEVWALHEDASRHIWFSTVGDGVYRFDPAKEIDGTAFTNFHEAEGLGTHAIQCMFEDQQGQFWLGGWQGLYRYDATAEQAGGKAFCQVTKAGPWN